MTETDPLLTLREMAEPLGVGPATPYMWRTRGVLPEPDDTELPDRPRWHLSTLLAWNAPRLAGQQPKWRARVVASAKAHTLTDGRPPGLNIVHTWWEDPEQWVEGEAEGTEELVVRIVRECQT